MASNTSQTAKAKVIKPRKLTRKQEAFVKHLIENPKDSATEAAIQSYNTDSRFVAAEIAKENLMKPYIVSELAKHSTSIENIITDKIYELTQGNTLESVKEGLLNARWAHDKIHGKATQKLETTTQRVSININLNADNSLTEPLIDS